jgi:hypothetical protein
VRHEPRLLALTKTIKDDPSDAQEVHQPVTITP